MDTVTESIEHDPNPMSGMDPEMAANPQVIYAAMRECPVMPLEDMGVGVLLSTKEFIDEALRHPETFSSNMDAVDLKNKRPMIPLQIDPPDQKKYRKLLDPLFSPRKMTAMEDEVAILVNAFIDRFIEKGEVDFSKEFSVPFPSQVFLTVLGLPLDELATFLTMKDGIIRPDHVTGKVWGRQGGQRLPADDRRLGLRVFRQGARRAPGRARATTCCRTSSTPRWRARSSAARRSWTSASCS